MRGPFALRKSVTCSCPTNVGNHAADARRVLAPLVPATTPRSPAPHLASLDEIDRPVRLLQPHVELAVAAGEVVGLAAQVADR